MMRFEKLAKHLIAKNKLSIDNLISIDDLSLNDIEKIFEVTDFFKEYFVRGKNKKCSLLKGTSIINFFFEESTRTRTSFELAGKHLGSDTINMSGKNTSMEKKGETLIDTAQTINALQADLIILRHGKAGTPKLIAGEIDAPVINAGDGWNEHPTQALIDAYTVKKEFGSLKGKNIVIVGDVLHSRVAGSLIRILKKTGANVTISGPKTMMPEKVEEVFDVKIEYDFDKAVENKDVLYSLRLQHERGAQGYFPSLREYAKRYVINEDRLNKAAKDAIVMHPGPVNREIDIRTEVLEGDRSRVFEMVENGLHLRLALLSLLVRT